MARSQYENKSLALIEARVPVRGVDGQCVIVYRHSLWDCCIRAITMFKGQVCGGACIRSVVRAGPYTALCGVMVLVSSLHLLSASTCRQSSSCTSCTAHAQQVFFRDCLATEEAALDCLGPKREVSRLRSHAACAFNELHYVCRYRFCHRLDTDFVPIRQSALVHTSCSFLLDLSPHSLRAGLEQGDDSTGDAPKADETAQQHSVVVGAILECLAECCTGILHAIGQGLGVCLSGLVETVYEHGHVLVRCVFHGLVQACGDSSSSSHALQNRKHRNLTWEDHWSPQPRKSCCTVQLDLYEKHRRPGNWGCSSQTRQVHHLQRCRHPTVCQLSDAVDSSPLSYTMHTPFSLPGTESNLYCSVEFQFTHVASEPNIDARHKLYLSGEWDR